jgi:hypothetical protein
MDIVKTPATRQLYICCVLTAAPAITMDITATIQAQQHRPLSTTLTWVVGTRLSLCLCCVCRHIGPLRLQPLRWLPTLVMAKPQECLGLQTSRCSACYLDQPATFSCCTATSRCPKPCPSASLCASTRAQQLRGSTVLHLGRMPTSHTVLNF